MNSYVGYKGDLTWVRKSTWRNTNASSSSGTVSVWSGPAGMASSAADAPPRLPERPGCHRESIFGVLTGEIDIRFGVLRLPAPPIWGSGVVHPGHRGCGRAHNPNTEPIRGVPPSKWGGHMNIRTAVRTLYRSPDWLTVRGENKELFQRAHHHQAYSVTYAPQSRRYTLAPCGLPRWRRRS